MKELLSWLRKNWFFLFQVVMAYVFAIPQLVRLFETTKGVTITWLLLADCFVILNFLLTLGSYRRSRNAEAFQALVIYGNWVVLVTSMVTIMFIKVTWTNQDWLVTSLVAMSAILVMLWAEATKRGIKDPLVRGILVGLFRVVPHFYLCYCILLAGSGSGIPWKTVVAANVTAMARIVTLYLSGCKTGWERGVKASFLSEVANESSWMLVTVVWLLH